MPDASIIAEPTVTVTTLPDGSREISATVRIPAASAITNCRRFEKEAQQATNTIGRKLMELGLQAFDTSGEPILVGQVNMTSKGPSPENYRTLFGPVRLDRHVYQTADGGKTFVPLEADARIISNSTPQLASCISNRYTEVCARKVERAFSESNQIQIDANLIQDLSRALGNVALAKEDFWSYKPEVAEEDVATIGLGIDGALVPILHEKEWRQAMAGTITLYNEKGEPLHTAYFAKAPQAGKEKFARQLAREVACYKKWYPKALWVGLSDGAEDLRALLTPHCEQLVLDFYHAAEYVSGAAAAMQEIDTPESRGRWLEKALRELKHKEGAARRLHRRMEQRLAQYARRGSESVRNLAAAVSYFGNNLDRMDYAACLAEGLPIGSGITEAACKTVVKHRFCGAGMRWHGNSMEQLLALKCLCESEGRWEEFWLRVEKRGY
jgi:hypothetical protein